MIGWIDDLPVGWMAVVVFAAVLLVTAAIYVAVMPAAVGGRGEAFKALSPGMLPPMALVWGLIVGFLAAGLWADAGTARSAVNREASALRSVVLVTAAAFPGQTSARMNALVRAQIQDAATREWPAMARQHATHTVVSAPLAAALNLALHVQTRTPGQVAAQRELVSLLDNALDARRQRIIVSGATVDWMKWTSILVLAVLTLVSIAFVHSAQPADRGDRDGALASAVAVTFVIIATQDRPFSRPFGVKPDVLLQVLPPAR